MGEITHGGRGLPLVAGKTIFDYADELEVRVPTSCGRTGICHECVVEVTKGHEGLSARKDAEQFLRGDFRLACQSLVEDTDSDVAFSLLHTNPKILTSALEKQLTIDPLVRRQGDSVYYGGDVIDKYRNHIYGVAIDLGTTTVGRRAG